MFKLFKNLRGRDFALIGVSVVLIVAQVWLDLKLPDYMREVTALLLDPTSHIGDIWLNGGYMLLCALGSAATAVLVGLIASRVAASFAARLRQKLFDKVESFSMAEINGFSIPSLITRSTNDITQVTMIVAMGMQVIIKAPILAVWAIIKILGKSWQWSVLTAGAVVAIVIMLLVIVIVALPRFRKIQTLTDNINRVTRENLTGIRVVRAYNAEQYQTGNFERANDELTTNNLVAQRVMAIMNPVMNLVMSGLSMGIYWIGAFLINNTADMVTKGILYADMIVFASYAMQVIMAFMLIAMIFIMLPRASVAAKRINEVLAVEPSIVDGKNAVLPTQIRGEVEFNDVSFRYPDADENVLEHISFKAKKGDTVAFIGSTGSGKSTLINLVPRFYDVTEGQVLVDGVDVRDYKLDDLHDKIGYVPQRGVMFAGTIASNVNYGSGAENRTLEDVKDAVRVAQATDFVEDKELAYESPIAQGGTNVSGGQKQRLSIARAVVKNPEIYIFDDSFSALDYKTDQELRKALKKHTADATSLIVAQRIGTIKNADQIIVLSEGKMVGRGSHEELLKTCDVYKEIALSQLSKEELENE